MLVLPTFSTCTFSAASRSSLRRWRQPMLKQILELGSSIERKILSASDRSSLSTQVTASSHRRRVSTKDMAVRSPYTRQITNWRKRCKCCTDRNQEVWINGCVIYSFTKHGRRPQCCQSCEAMPLVSLKDILWLGRSVISNLFCFFIPDLSYYPISWSIFLKLNMTEFLYN